MNESILFCKWCVQCFKREKRSTTARGCGTAHTRGAEMGISPMGGAEGSGRDGGGDISGVHDVATNNKGEGHTRHANHARVIGGDGAQHSPHARVGGEVHV